MEILKNSTLFISIICILCSCSTNKKEQPSVHFEQSQIDSLLDESFSYLRKDLEVSIKLSRRADSLSKRHEYSKGHSRSLRIQAYYYHYIDQPVVALELLDESERLELITNNTKGLVSTYNVKAWLFKKLELYQDALDNYSKAISLNESNITTGRKIIGENNIANIYTMLSKPDSAIIHYRNALEHATLSKDTHNLAVIYTNLGNAQCLLNNFESAEKNYLKALTLSQKVKYQKQIAKIYNNLGALFYEAKKDSIALFYYKNSIEVKYKLQDSLALAKSYFNIAELYFQNKTYNDISDKYLNSSERIFKSFNNIDHLSKVHLFRGDKYKSNRQYLKAKVELEKAEKLLSYSLEISTKSHVYKKLAEVLNLLNEHEKAFEMYQKYDALNDSILNADKLWNVAEQEKKHLIKIKQNEISLLEKDKLIANANTLKKQEENKKLLFSLGGVILISILLALFIIYFYRLRKTESLLAVQQETILKNEMQNLVNEQELRIVNATLDARKKEKEVISKELHNNIGSLLTSAKFHFQSFDENFLFSDISTKNLYLKTTDIIDTIIEEIRSLSHRFDKDSLPGFNLKNAVTEFLRKVDSKKLSVQSTIHGLDSLQNTDISIFIFRALQELVNNVIKHAHASQLIVYITQNADGINIMVEDNGKGFDTNHKREGIGLKNLNKQVDELNGEFFIDSNLGHGCTININIPISEKP